MLSVSTVTALLTHRKPLTIRMAELSKQNEIFVRNYATIKMSFFVASFPASGSDAFN